jgi:hypothetical protein
MLAWRRRARARGVKEAVKAGKKLAREKNFRGKQAKAGSIWDF